MCLLPLRSQGWCARRPTWTTCSPPPTRTTASSCAPSTTRTARRARSRTTRRSVAAAAARSRVGLTINRSQGQTLERALLDLRRPAFSHGHAYVAISRVQVAEALVSSLTLDTCCVTSARGVPCSQALCTTSCSVQVRCEPTCAARAHLMPRELHRPRCSGRGSARVWLNVRSARRRRRRAPYARQVSPYGT